LFLPKTVALKLEQALAVLRSGLDLTNALHHASCRACEAIASFDDRGFARRIRQLNLPPALPQHSRGPDGSDAIRLQPTQKLRHVIMHKWLWRIPKVIPFAMGARAGQPQGELLVSGSADFASIDAWLLAVLEDEDLRQQVRQLKKVELAHVWQLTRASLLLRHCRETYLPMIIIIDAGKSTHFLFSEATHGLW
jgi:hypothetical protein